MVRMLAALCLLAAPVAQAQTPPAGSVHDEIARLYARIDESLGRKDPEFFLSLMAPEIVITDENGAGRTLADTGATLRQAMSKIGELTVRTEPALIVGSGDRAWATTKQVAHVRLQPTSAGGTPISMTLTTVDIDAWQRGKDGWRIVEERTLIATRQADRAQNGQVAGGGPDMRGWTPAQKLQYANQLACQTRAITAMGWQRQGYLAVMPSC